jgi:glycopeptide antibiotics resistance protein
LKRGMPTKKAYASSVLNFVVTIFLLGLLILTLAPSADRARTVEWMPFEQLGQGGSSREAVVAEMLGNVILFIPVGLLAPARWQAMRSFKRVILAGAAFSLLIETLQFALNLGRQPSVTDIIMNTSGATLGWLLFLLLRRRMDRLHIPGDTPS